MTNINYKKDMILRLTRKARKNRVTHLFEVDEVIKIPKVGKRFPYDFILRGRRLYWDPKENAYISFGKQKVVTVSRSGDILTYDKFEVIAPDRRTAAHIRIKIRGR